MKKYMDKLKKKIIINKTLLIFLITIVIIGILSGSIFASIINEKDQKLVTEYLIKFIENIKNNSLKKNFLNSLTINIGFLSIIWVLGISIIGIFLIIPLLFIKSFILGFSIASIFINYKFKGILLILSYIIPHQIINILIYVFISSYAIMISHKIINSLKNKKTLNFKKLINKYTLILIYTSIIITLTTLYEVYLQPIILKQAVNLIK